MNPSWFVLGTPVFLTGVLVLMGYMERKLTADVVSDEVRRYLRAPEPPDDVEAAVARLLETVAVSQEWAGAGSNRRPSAFQADARTD